MDAIFSSTRNRGHKTDISRWGDLGLDGQWNPRPIHLYEGWGSGLAIWNRGPTLICRAVTNNGEFKEFRQPKRSSPFGSWRADYNFGVGDENGISVGLVRNKLRLFKAVPLGSPPISPTAGNCYRGDYPLAERISLVISPDQMQKENQIKSPALVELLKFMLSRQGQIELSSEYLSLSYDLAKESAHRVGIKLPVRKSYSDAPPAIAGLLSQTYPQEKCDSLMLELSEPVVSVHHNSSQEATNLIQQWHRSKNFDALIETVTFFDDSRSAVTAAVALVSLGRAEYWKHLRSFSQHDHKDLRSWVIHEIGSVHHSETIEILISLLDDESLVAVGPRTTIADEALEALRSTTGQTFGKDGTKWTQWWDSIGRKDFESAKSK